MDGTAKERTLARHLDDEGYAVMRSPASGSATDRDQPDLLFGKHGEVNRAVELKTTSKAVAYFDSDEVRALQRFARGMGAIPLLAGRFKGDTSVYCYSITKARNTPTGRYAVDRDIYPTMVFEP